MFCGIAIVRTRSSEFRDERFLSARSDFRWNDLPCWWMVNRRPREVIERYAVGRYRLLESGTHGDLCRLQVVGPSGVHAEDVLWEKSGQHSCSVEWVQCVT
jgi:hypothetical protein